MQRRKFVRILMSVVAAPRLLFSQQSGAKAPMPAAAPVPWYLGLNSRTPLPTTAVADQVAASELKFFTQAQMQTLTALSRIFLPASGNRPGAIEAGTPEFLDFLLSDSPAEKQKIYSGGLDWLEADAQKKFKAAFAQLDEAQAGELIRPWLRTWLSDHPPTELHADFINLAHDEIRAATFNSKSFGGGSQELYWEPIEPEVALLSVQPHVAAAEKSRPMPMYRR